MSETPKTPDVVYRVQWTYVILALTLGLAIGAAALYLFTERVPEGEASDA